MTNKTLYIELLSDDAILPVKAHSSDAGVDLYATEDVLLKFNKPVKVKTGIAIKLPANTVGDIRPRSSLNAKGVHVGYGTVDAGYTGEIQVVMSAFWHKIHKGDKIAQLVVLPLVSYNTVKAEVSKLKTDRGNKGFGSSGK